VEQHWQQGMRMTEGRHNRHQPTLPCLSAQGSVKHPGFAASVLHATCHPLCMAAPPKPHAAHTHMVWKPVMSSRTKTNLQIMWVCAECGSDTKKSRRQLLIAAGVTLEHTMQQTH
jgi:hypothetical protein